METEANLLDDDFEEDEMYSFSNEMYKALSSCIKQFLIDYTGERFYTLEAETYREIESIIKEDIESFSEDIPDILYQNRTIRDSVLWDEAFDKFDGNISAIVWPENPHWYDKIDPLEEEDFLEDIPESELTEDQKLAKEIVETADDILNSHYRFGTFMKNGCLVLVPAMQTYIQEVASFDLYILSPEGFSLLKRRLEMMAEITLEHLYNLLRESL